MSILDTANVVCPNCRSELQKQAVIDFNPPKIQIVRCPVCDYPIWLTPPFLSQVRYTGFKVITRIEPMQTFADVQKTNPELAPLAETLPTGEAKPLFSFDLSGILSGLGSNVKLAAGFILAALVLVYLIKRSK